MLETNVRGATYVVKEIMCRSTSKVNSPWQSEVGERNIKPETRDSGPMSRPLKELAPLPSRREVWITASYSFMQPTSKPSSIEVLFMVSIPSEPAREPGHAVSYVSYMSKFEFCGQRTMINLESRVVTKNSAHLRNLERIFVKLLVFWREHYGRPRPLIDLPTMNRDISWPLGVYTRQTSERQIERAPNQQVDEETITGVDGGAKRRRNDRLSWLWWIAGWQTHRYHAEGGFLDFSKV
jgi:hypothetical protein